MRQACVGLVCLTGCEFITGELDSETDAPPVDNPTSRPENVASSGEVVGTTGVSDVGPATEAGGDSTSGEGDISTTGERHPPNDGPCCSPSDGPGCGDFEVEQCVCAIDEFCCDEIWDELCVDLMMDSGCGACENAGDCCSATLEAGCSQPEVEACVCAFDEYCCEAEWDGSCAAGVEVYGCGACELGDDPSCCVPHAGSSCESVEVAECVCAIDEYCCEVQWDGACVEAVAVLGCGPCDGSPTMDTGTDSGWSSTGVGWTSTGAWTGEYTDTEGWSSGFPGTGFILPPDVGGTGGMRP